MDLEVQPILALANAGNIGADGKCLIGGMRTGIPAMPAGARTLFPLRAALRRGEIAISHLDASAGGDLSPRLLRLAGKVGATVVLCWSELEPDGVVSLTYQSPPFPLCDTEAKVQANLAIIREQRRRIFSTLGETC